jgi:hypothetical protein
VLLGVDAGTVSFQIGSTRDINLSRFTLVAAIATSAFLALPGASQAKSDRPSASAVASSRHVEVAADTADSAVTPLVSPRVREFVASRTDFARSALLGRIVVPLLLILLAERELLMAGGRTEERIFLAYGLPLIAAFVVLALARVRAYRA